MPSIEQLEQQLAEMRAMQKEVNTLTNSVPAAVETPMVENRYAATAWGGQEYDFTTPSGQLCRLRRLPIEELAKQGILDKVTRLPGLTSQLVKSSQGLPPEEQPMPDAEQLDAISEITLLLMPIVVVAPEVHPLPVPGDAKVEGLIYADSVDFMDRVAIMNRVLAPLAKLDAFRNVS